MKPSMRRYVVWNQRFPVYHSEEWVAFLPIAGEVEAWSAREAIDKARESGLSRYPIVKVVA